MKIKEKLDDMYADYGVELKNAGCWPGLSPEKQRDICHAARSADHPSDYTDNEIGVACGEKNKACGFSEYACKECCTQGGVPQSACDGPPLRPYGPRTIDFPECDFHDPGPRSYCNGTFCDFAIDFEI